MSVVMLKKIFHIGLFTLSFSCHASLSISGSLIRERMLSVNEQATEVISIENVGDSPLTIQVIQHDYIRDKKGERILVESNTTLRSNSSWISFGKHSITIPPHSSHPFAYTVKTPDDASLNGTYWSYVTIEPTDIEEIIHNQEGTLNVRTVIKYGILISTHIANTGVNDLKISKENSYYNPQGKSYLLNVENIGTLAIMPKLSMEVFTLQGKSLGHFQADFSYILPGCTAVYPVDISKIPAGEYKAIALLDNEKNEVFASQLDLTIP
jgi:hypothetical protein